MRNAGSMCLSRAIEGSILNTFTMETIPHLRESSWTKRSYIISSQSDI